MRAKKTQTFSRNSQYRRRLAILLGTLASKSGKGYTADIAGSNIPRMKKFMVLYMMPKEAMAEMMKTMTPEAQQKSMGEWKTWMGANASSFVDMGAPLGKNTRVTSDGVTDVSNEIGGYSIMQAESKEALAEVLKGSPHFGMAGMYVEVMEVMPM